MSGEVVSWGAFRRFRLRNAHGVVVELSDLGATILSWWVPGADGVSRNIVLGYDSPEAYLKGSSYLGCVVGPWANRIADGRYSLSGRTVQLEQNEGNNHLHGGACAVHKRRWQLVSLGVDHLSLSLKVRKGEGGYPANIQMQVDYCLDQEGRLHIDYQAHADDMVPLNLTQHSYFNLSGLDSIADTSESNQHFVQIYADKVFVNDERSIPQELIPVADTPFDFRSAKGLTPDLLAAEPLHNALGFDHCYLLQGDGLREVASVYAPHSQLQLIMMTDQPGVQFYSGNHLAADTSGEFKQYQGLCLEAQHFPNQINMPDYRDLCLYGLDRVYRQKTLYLCRVKTN